MVPYQLQLLQERFRVRALDSLVAGSRNFQCTVIQLNTKPRFKLSIECCLPLPPRVYVAGRITYNVYKDGEGVLKEATSIVADDVIPFT